LRHQRAIGRRKTRQSARYSSSIFPDSTAEGVGMQSLWGSHRHRECRLPGVNGGHGGPPHGRKERAETPALQKPGGRMPPLPRYRASSYSSAQSSRGS
jgi:hypothetical protein